MKTLFVLLLFISSINVKADSWAQKANFPGFNVVGCFSFVVNNLGYIGCGDDSITGDTKAFWEFNPATNSWTQKADFGGAARRFGVAFTILDKGYAGFGETQGIAYYNDLWEYDLITNSWTQKSNAPMYNRTNAVGFSIGNLGFVGTGLGTNTGNWPNNDFWAYDPITDSWSQKANLPGSPRTNAVGCSSGNKGYIGTGADSLSNPLRDWWEYDALTDTWIQKADFPGAPRADAGCMSICGKVYLGTGDTTTSLTTADLMNDFWQYDPITNQWQQKTDYAGNKTDEDVFFSIGNKGYVGLGSDTRYNYDLWEYTPDSISNCEFSNINNNLSLLYHYHLSMITDDQLLFYFYQPWENNNLEITIIDLSGKIILLNQFEIINEQQQMIDVRSLSKGLYLIKVKLDQFFRIDKFIKV